MATIRTKERRKQKRAFIIQLKRENAKLNINLRLLSLN
jgi:hypothetical protein